MPVLKNICLGDSHSLILSNKGSVYSFGSNAYGQLGVGDFSNRNTPTLIPNLTNIVQISTRFKHSLLLDNNGKIYSFGDNSRGQLGFASEIKYVNIPTLIPKTQHFNIIQIAVGDNHSLLLDKNGKVYAFGNNMYGRLGIGDNIDRYEPTLIPKLKNICQIAAGDSHSLALDNQGNVYAFGSNAYGKLGIGNYINKNTPQLISTVNNIVKIFANGNNSVVINNKNDIYFFGRIFGLGNDINKPKLFNLNVIENNDISLLETGIFHLLILDNYGQVHSFGFNSCGQLGLGDSDVRDKLTAVSGLDMEQISIGTIHSSMIDNNGKIYMFGYNGHGQLGLGDNIDRKIPTIISNFNINQIN
jgi:alpha-tubulin suppressor-like RCC1 family protein